MANLTLHQKDRAGQPCKSENRIDPSYSAFIVEPVEKVPNQLLGQDAEKVIL